MKFGFVLPSGNVHDALRFAEAAETAGWDGFFVWEPVWGNDPWVTLAAVAMRTTRIRLGTLLTPLSRRRPWKVASETATLDHLSNGRVILSVGLGAPDTGFANFGEVTDRKTRAELLDESIDILTGLWRGQPFNYDGKHYHIKETSFMPPAPPVQKPRIPIWVVGAWPHKKSMERVLRCDGLLPTTLDENGRHLPPTPAQIAEMKAYVEANRQLDSPFDIITESQTPLKKKTEWAEIIRPWAEAGTTWWIESMWDAPNLDAVFERVQHGPPK
jgi:alkanesulfonate monooxygenase SsuD/methylene tetrahydromethanopterin reductase-like flavin-dependent oxidoreductase (luciferase family)